MEAMNMPVTHLIHTILRPGVQNIQVQYKYQSTDVWTNYNDGQRIPGGVDVKFIVTTYPNFTLTEWIAYYSDEYDDTVNIALTGVQGQSAWTFTMPSSDIYIRCMAESRSESTVVFPPDQTSTGSIVDFATAKECFDHLVQTYSLVELPDIIEYIREKFPNRESEINRMLDRHHYVVVIINTRWSTSSLPGKTCYLIGIQVASEVPVLPIPVNSYMSDRGQLTFEIVYNITDGAWYEGDNFPRVVNTTAYRYQIFSNKSGDICQQSNPLLSEHSPGQTVAYSIRYIMSPENSGEVDASAPSEIAYGTTEFTFKWRVKATYEFKRLTPFAVGEGSLEDDVVYSAQYDGDNRTYTFTISSIPEWAIGVRVLIETIMTEDPSSSIGDNGSDGPIGGDGTYDDTSDEVPLPAIPDISISDSGFITLFRPSIAQVKELGNYLWSNLTDFIENLQKIFTSPMDYFIAFNLMPVTPLVGPERNIYIGNWLSNISMPPILNQFYEFNCGTVQIKEYFGSFLDYAPNTRARIMLPFIGDRELDTNEIMNKTLHLWYRIDLLSGSCVAVLTINNSVYYQWSGNCAVGIPVTGSDWSRLYSSAARVATVGLGLAIGGLAGGATSTFITNNASGVAQGSAVASLGRVFNSVPTGIPGVSRERTALLNAMENVNTPATTQITSHTSRAINGAMIGNIIGYNAMASTQRTQHTGDMTGSISIMGNRTPFIVLEYPNVNLPEKYKHIVGYPSNQYVTLSNVSGYTKCKTVMFESTKATDDEIEMVITALKGGVYL